MTTRKIFETTLPDGKKTELYGKGTGDQEIHIDGAWGLMISSGNCKINLYTLVPTEDHDVERREVAARITMSIPTLFALRDFFDAQVKFLQELQESGDGVVPDKAKSKPKSPTSRKRNK